MSAASVVTPIRNPSLFQIEERLEMLFCSEDFIDPAAPEAEHLRAQLAQEIAQALQSELGKVDGIANYLTFLENQQAFAESEISRLKLRKSKFERRQERIEASVITLLQAQGRARIEGHTTFLALRACPPSLEVLDPDAIPCEYKEQVITSETKIDKTKIKKMLKLQVHVPGVKLTTDKQRLVRG